MTETRGPAKAVEHHIEITRQARYWELGEDIEHPREVWHVLHGYKQLASRFIRRFHPIDDGTRRIIAPEGLSRFYIGLEAGRHGPASIVGATWMTREDRAHEIEDYVAYLDRLQNARRAENAHVTVLGFSQGVATAARWVTAGEVQPDRLVLWGDVLPPDLDLERAGEALRSVDVVLVRGTEDRAISDALAERERGQLAKAGVEYRVVEYGGGHEIDRDALMALVGG